MAKSKVKKPKQKTLGGAMVSQAPTVALPLPFFNEIQATLRPARAALARPPKTDVKKDKWPTPEEVLAQFAELTPQEQKIVFQTLKDVIEANKSAENWTDEPLLTSKEHLRLEIANLQQSFALRHHLLVDALTVTEAQALLNVKSRQTVHDRRKAGTLLGVEDNGKVRFPCWQFDATGPHGVLTGLPAVLKVLNRSRSVSDTQKVEFFICPLPELKGRTPLQALKDGEERLVVALAQRLGVC